MTRQTPDSYNLFHGDRDQQHRVIQPLESYQDAIRHKPEVRKLVHEGRS